MREVLIQALLDAPMFATRWRWVAGVSLALPRMRGGRKVPPQLTRMAAEDLIVSVFPDQLACAENLPGDREIPDHPLLRQVIADCLVEAMDIEGLERLLTGLESGAIAVIAARSDPAFAAGPGGHGGAALCLSRRCAARGAPHPGGDGRRWLAPEEAPTSAASIPRPSSACAARPGPRPPTPMSFTTRWSGWASSPPARSRRGRAGCGWLAELARDKRAARLRGARASTIWIAAERLAQFQALFPERGADAEDRRAAGYDETSWSAKTPWSRSCAAGSKGWGPSPRQRLPRRLGCEAHEIAAALAALEAEGFVHARALHARRQ